MVSTMRPVVISVPMVIISQGLAGSRAPDFIVRVFYQPSQQATAWVVDKCGAGTVPVRQAVAAFWPRGPEPWRRRAVYPLEGIYRSWRNDAASPANISSVALTTMAVAVSCRVIITSTFAMRFSIPYLSA